MQTEYHKWYSPSLGHDMELKVYGHYGKPVLAFPAQEGRFYDFEDFGMVGSVAHQIEAGKIKLFCVDGIDWQTWANWDAHPADRARRHNAYDAYICSEVIPFIRQHCGDSPQKVLTTGPSMGGYHAVNFYFRHPNLFDAVISLSGIFRLNMFVGNYMDENVYYNSPLHYLPNLNDAWYLEQYRKSQIVIVVGQGPHEGEMIREAHLLKKVLQQKSIPAWFDIWGHDVAHDWPWWRAMLPYFIDKLNLG